MTERKLIALRLETSDNIIVDVTLLKQFSRYKIRTEYLRADDKIKETNNEIERYFVYQLFCDLETANFETLTDAQNDSIGCLTIFYGDEDYLERKFNQEILKQSKEFRKVIITLLEFVDNSVDKTIF